MITASKLPSAASKSSMRVACARKPFSRQCRTASSLKSMPSRSHSAAPCSRNIESSRPLPQPRSRMRRGPSPIASRKSRTLRASAQTAQPARERIAVVRVGVVVRGVDGRQVAQCGAGIQVQVPAGATANEVELARHRVVLEVPAAASGAASRAPQTTHEDSTSVSVGRGEDGRPSVVQVGTTSACCRISPPRPGTAHPRTAVRKSALVPPEQRCSMAPGAAALNCARSGDR